MAYQPKSYRKFLATSVTAALVASAVAPAALAAEDSVITNNFVDVDRTKHAWAIDAIDYLVGKKAIEGKGNRIFDIHGNLTRAEAATILARTLDLEIDENAKPNFSDTDNHWAAKYIAAIQNQLPGVIEGYQGKFNPNNYITRQELAKIIVEAYDLELVEDADIDFPDNKGWGAEYVNILASNGIVIGKPSGKFEPNSNVTRGEAAVFFYRTEVEEARVEVPGVEKELKVEEVTATNQTTLTITGTGLDKLSEENIEVENNAVKTITVSADGKTATVVLENELVVDEATKVTINGKEFTVTYSIDVDEVSIVEATYDDDTKDQYVALKVNGKTLYAQELINAGYTVKFEAFKTKAARDEVPSLFEDDETGKLSDELDQGSFLTEMGLSELPAAGVDVYVKVTLVKGTEVISSDIGKIKIQNIDLAANSITDFVLTNVSADASVKPGFEYNSTTLVAGEVAEVSEITVKAGSDEEDITDGYTLESSNKSVLTVDGKEITAQGPGTATLTIKYGGISKSVTITVKNEKREISKVSLEKTNLKVGKDQLADSKIYLLDQYGDPMAGDVQVVVSNKDVVKVTDASGTEINYDNFSIDNDPDNETKIYVKGEKQGSASITFRDAAGVKIGTTTLTVNVSENTDLHKYELKVDNDISDSDVTKVNNVISGTATKDDITTTSELDLLAEKYVKIDLKAYNSQGFELKEYTDSSDYKVEVNPSRAGVIEEVYKGDGYIVVEAGSVTGSATIVVTSEDKATVKQQIKLTVVEKGYNITDVAFKAFANPTYSQTINYEDVLTYRKVADGKDPVISGLKLSKDTSYPIRLDLSTAEFYIDKNANGVQDGGDRVVGELELTYTGTFANPSTDPINGIDVESGDDGTVLFKVLDSTGKVVGTKAIEVDF